jgi:uncharacterized protein YciI
MSTSHFLIRLSGAQPELMTPELVSEHVSYLHRLHDSGHLVLCGPCEDGTAIIVLRCSDRAEAERLAARDPFAHAGAYRERSIAAFRLATPENNFLLK